METSLLIVIFSLLGGVVSLIGGALLLSRKTAATKIGYYATPFAAGALLSAVFLDLLKEGLELQSSVDSLMYAVLGGILLFFFMERFLRWFHHHHAHDSEIADPKVGLVILGDTLHNALDGVAIAAAFMIDTNTGIVTTLAVAAHEIPQEIGDFGLLLSRGLSRGRVLFWNAMSALSTTAMALITYWIGSTETIPLQWLLGLSAGFLLYIAMSDLIPTIHDSMKSKKLLDLRPLFLLVGVVSVAVSIAVAHKYIDAGHEHDEHVTEVCVVDEGHNEAHASELQDTTETEKMANSDHGHKDEHGHELACAHDKAE